MKRKVLNFAKSALGLAALVAFVLALVWLFSPLSQKVPVGQQEQPVGTATATASLPLATATPEPYPPPPMPLPDTPTPGPYPPPRTRTPVPFPPPTFSPTPPLPTPTGPIPSTYDIIWAETAWIREEDRPVSITFWRANVADLDNQIEIATLPIAQRLSNARLSPDGDKIAFTACSGSCSYRDGSLWVMSVDGSEVREIAQGIDAVDALGHSPAWSPDGRSLIYLRVVLKKVQQSEASPHIHELHSVSVDGTKDKTLVTEKMAGIYPLGWSADGGAIYYERTLSGTELWRVKATGESPPEFVSSLPSSWSSPRFSPDGTKLTIYAEEEGLVLLSSDGQERRVLSPLSEPFSGIWSADSTEIIGPYWDRLQLRALNVNTRAARDLITPQLTDRDRLISTSPDGQWLVVRVYGSGQISLLWIGTSVRVEVPESEGLHSSYLVGWIPTE
jgi:Tol biopolymer transport system component